MLYLRKENEMKLLVIILLTTMSGCMSSKIPNLTPAPNSPPQIHNIPFKEVDINRDGNINESEFAQIPQSPELDTTTPVIWFILLVVLIAGMVSITRIIKSDKKE